MTTPTAQIATARRTFASTWSTLRRRFASHANVVQTAVAVERLPGESLHAHWIVGRGLCMFRCEDFANVPKNRRRTALELRVPVWSPFERTGHHCVWSGSTAMVWLWNADAVADTAAADANGGPVIRADTARILPETLFLPRRSDGICLQPCQHGFDLQHWRDGILRESFWFPQRPSPAEVEAIGHSAGVGDAPTPAETVPLAADPWANPPDLAAWLTNNERTLVTAGLFVLLLSAVWFEVRIWAVGASAATAATELARLEDELGPLLTERSEFLRLRQLNEGWWSTSVNRRRPI